MKKKKKKRDRKKIVMQDPSTWPEDVEVQQLAMPASPDVVMTIRAKYQAQKDWMLAGFYREKHVNNLIAICDEKGITPFQVQIPILRIGEKTGLLPDRLELAFIPKECMTKAELLEMMTKYGATVEAEGPIGDVVLLSADYRIMLINAIQSLLKMYQGNDN